MMGEVKWYDFSEHSFLIGIARSLGGFAIDVKSEMTLPMLRLTSYRVINQVPFC